MEEDAPGDGEGYSNVDPIITLSPGHPAYNQASGQRLWEQLVDWDALHIESIQDDDSRGEPMAEDAMFHFLGLDTEVQMDRGGQTAEGEAGGAAAQSSATSGGTAAAAGTAAGGEAGGSAPGGEAGGSAARGEAGGIAADDMDAELNVDDSNANEVEIIYDKDHPKMELGGVFPTMHDFKMAVRQFAINEEFELGTEKSDKVRFRGFCLGEYCPWRIVGRRRSDQTSVMITVLFEEHKCSSSSRLGGRTASLGWIADKAVPILRRTPNMTAMELKRKLELDFNYPLKYDTVWKGHQRALKQLYGSWEDSFKWLFRWRAEVLKWSPGSVVEIGTRVVEGKWMRSSFIPDVKCDYINNNLAECFNNWIRDIKDLPVCDLADKIRQMIMVLWNKRRRIGEKLHGRILPAIIQQLKARTRGLGHLQLVKCDRICIEVCDNIGGRNVVRTAIQECTCLEWQHTGKPCDHALVVITAQMMEGMEDFVHEYYSVQKFRAAYGQLMVALPDKSYWPEVDLSFEMGAPLSRRAVGRQRKLRIKGVLEGGSKSSVKKKTHLRGPITCQRCGQVGHRQASYKCPHNGTKKRKRKNRKNQGATEDESQVANQGASQGVCTRSQAASQGVCTRSMQQHTPEKAAPRKMTPKKAPTSARSPNVGSTSKAATPKKSPAKRSPAKRSPAKKSLYAELCQKRWL